jgi:hypothetical protein
MQNKKKYFIVFAIVLFISTLSYGSVVVRPPLIFIDSPKKTFPLEITNVTDKEVEVSVEIKYGYTDIDDSNRIIIRLPEVLKSDDRSSVDWTTAYPLKFLLSPKERRYIRLIVNPPMGLQDGEYWGRVIIISKPTTKSIVSKKISEKTQVGFEFRNQQSIPFLYRKGLVNTSVEIVKAPVIKQDGKFIIFQCGLERFGNSSFWGRMNFELINEKGKVVKRNPQHFVVYKKIDYAFKIDISDVPKGNYVLSTTAETVRTDDAAKYLIKTNPKNWKHNIRID